MGASTHTFWCAAGEEVLLITDDQVVRLPNSVARSPNPGLAASPLSPGEDVLVGGGVVATRTSALRIVRWWDPQVRPIEAERRHVRRLARNAAESVPSCDREPLVVALRDHDHRGVVEAADRYLGRGEGLTPEGDDFLTGVVAGYRHASASVGDVPGALVLQAIRTPVLAAARRSTTSLSRTLLRHAFDGEVPAPVGSLLRALTGRGDLAAALDATIAIGHRSGPALATGVVAGVAAECGVEP